MKMTFPRNSIFSLLLIPLMLAYFGLSHSVQAVSPTPDGAYPGANTAEGGSGALFSLTTGTNNTALGSQALQSLTTGVQNTAVGAQALKNNTADKNTAAGFQALISNTIGNENAATGWRALFKNTGGAFNTANGSRALYDNTTAFGNTAIGADALSSNIADFNTAIGAFALMNNNTGGANTAIGTEALLHNTTGSSNIAVGDDAGINITGHHNIDIGNDGLAGESGTIRLGNNGAHTATYIGGIAGQIVGAGGTTCYVDNDGRLGVFLSARRFKTDIADMGAASDALLALRPVTFHYKPELDKTGIPQFGLVAEEVAKVNPDLVTRDAKGELSTVRYEAVNAMLLNEFLKEHRAVQELKSTSAKQGAIIAKQQKQIEALTAGLQKVSAQLEASKPAPRVVNNP